MTAPAPAARDAAFLDQMQKNVEKFGHTAGKVINAMLEAHLEDGQVQLLETAPSFENNVVISIMFTGMVYGEYILAMDESTAAKLVDPSSTGARPELRETISEAFSEILNIIVGETIVDLGHVFKKLTITAPKVLFGKISYPKVRAAKMNLSSPKGQVDCFLYIDRMKLDIAASYKDAMSSLIRANQELKDAMTKLQEQQGMLLQAEKMGALGTMAAGVAHEINTPLATISLLGSQLKDHALDTEQMNRDEFVKALDTIEMTVQRISKITNSLRTFANGIRGEKFVLRSVKSLVDESIILCEEYIREKKVQLIWNSSLEADIECKPIEVCQVLMNLILNACDAAETTPSKWIKIETQEIKDKVEIRVIDSGNKIPDNVQTKMFDPFFTTKEVGKGAGLGLSVARGIVNGHGGELKVAQNTPNTCLVLRLPRRVRKTA